MNNRGFALPMVLGVVAILTILSISLHSLLTIDKTGDKLIASNNAFYAADNGIQTSIWRLNTKGFAFVRDTGILDGTENINGLIYEKYRLPDGDNNKLLMLVPADAASKSIILTANDIDHVILRSTGKYNDLYRTIEVNFFNDDIWKITFLTEIKSHIK